jgi:thiosulfate/3-mercaptopyruvate sulfurtransferase
MFCIKAKSIKRFHVDSKIATARKHIMETGELNEILKSDKLKNLKVLDCSWFLPTDPRKADELFNIERIPNSQLFNIDEVADKSSDLPHMMPSEHDFIKHMKSMDIRKNDHIVCYDRVGVFSAPRAWFTFKVFGCPSVYVLNGGFPKWVSENLPLERGNDFGYKNISREVDESEFNYELNRSKVVDINKVAEISGKITTGKNQNQIVDCRPAPRYRGEVDEPRQCMRKGHIDGALNVFFKDLLDEKSCFKSDQELIEEFEKRSVDVNKPTIFSCGSGCTACVDILAMTLIDKYDNTILYDGSWSEYVID